MFTSPGVRRTAALLVLALCACEGPADSQGGDRTLPAEANLVRTLLGQALVISQVYGGGGSTGSTYNADWVEIHNTSNVSVNMTGYSLQYSSSMGNSWPSKTPLPTTVLPAGGYFLVQVGASNATGAVIAPDFKTISFTMAATAGKIGLVQGTTRMPNGICPGSAAIDFVGYGDANCSEPAAGPRAPSPSTTTTISRKNNGCTDTDTNSTDLEVRGGTGPAIVVRNSATQPFSCGATDAGTQGGTIPCGSDGATCPSTSCCDDLGYISFCVDPSDFCFNGSQCNPGNLTCEFSDAGTVDPGVHSVGSACVTDLECQTDMGTEAVCKKVTTPGNSTYQSGYCTLNCSLDGLCPPLSACVNLSLYGEAERLCWNACGNGVQCRNGYACYQDTTTSTRGCWIDPTPARYDGGTPVDGGVISPVDAGPVDAGKPSTDSGVPMVDAGMTTVDAGTPMVDAGMTTAPDAGAPVVDAGMTTVDAGTTTMSDAGMTMSGDDAGMTTTDAGGTMTQEDAGTEAGTDSGVVARVDAGTKDAGVARRDAGTSVVTPPDNTPGCGCSSTETGMLLPFGLAALALRRRRARQA